jgi:hypothetical protein
MIEQHDDPHDEYALPANASPPPTPNLALGNRAEWAQVIVAIVGLIGVGLGVFVANSTLARVTEQTDVMRRSLESADRPWLRVTLSPRQSNPIPAPHLSFSTTIENVGRSVATDVTLSFGLVTHGFGQQAADDIFERPASEQDRICESGLTQTGRWSRNQLVFPGDKVAGIETSINYDIEAARRAATTMPSSTGRTNFGAVLVACVTYRFGTSASVHSTRLGYYVTRTAPGQSPPGAYALTLEDFVPAELLFFTDAFKVFFAD